MRTLELPIKSKVVSIVIFHHMSGLSSWNVSLSFFVSVCQKIKYIHIRKKEGGLSKTRPPPQYGASLYRHPGTRLTLPPVMDHQV